MGCSLLRALGLGNRSLAVRLSVIMRTISVAKNDDDDGGDDDDDYDENDDDE